MIDASHSEPPKKGCGCWTIVAILVGLVILVAIVTPAKAPTKLAPPYGDALNFHTSQKVFTRASYLNMREHPYPEAKIIARLPIGTDVVIADRSREWLKVYAQERHGWVSARYVSAELPQALGLRGAATESGASRAQSGSGEASRQIRSRRTPSRRAWIGKGCKKGKPCGNSCIARNKTCRK